MEDARHPVTGVDYPQAFQAMDEWFRSDEGLPGSNLASTMAERVYLPPMAERPRRLGRCREDACGAEQIPTAPRQRGNEGDTQFVQNRDSGGSPVIHRQTRLSGSVRSLSLSMT